MQVAYNPKKEQKKQKEKAISVLDYKKLRDPAGLVHSN